MCCCAASESVYVDTIAPMFGLDHNCPIWIVKKDGNIAVWPCGGTFSGPQVTVGAVYEVKGQSEPKPTSESPLLSSPFGAYVHPPYSGSMRPNSLVTPVHPSLKRKKGWTKTVVVVSLKKRWLSGKRKFQSGVTHVSLYTSSPCTVRKVTDVSRKLALI